MRKHRDTEQQKDNKKNVKEYLQNNNSLEAYLLMQR